MSMSPAPIKMGIIPFAPYYYTTADGHQDGVIYNKIKRISQKLNQKLITYNLSPQRAIKELAGGNIDFVVAITTFPNLNKVAYVGNWPLSKIKLCAFSRKGTKLMTNYSDLNGKNVIILQGYNYGGLIKYIKDPKNKVKYHIVENHAIGVKMMQRGRADYLLAYKGPTEMALKQRPIPDMKYRTLHGLNLYFIFSKKFAEGDSVLTKYEKLYREETKSSIEL